MGVQEAIFSALVVTAADDRERLFLERHRSQLTQAIGDAFAASGCAVCPTCASYCGSDRAAEAELQDPEHTAIWKGLETTVFYPSPKGGKSGLGSLNAFYALVPAEGVVQSHNPFTFAPSPGYPPALQERPYDRDQLEQVKVIRQAETLQPAFLVNTNPDSVNGPPIIDERGMVLGGNSRVMSIKRVLAEGPGNVYSRYLAEAVPRCGGTFGLADAPTDGMILVRVLVDQYDPISVSRDLNRALTQSLDLSAQAVSLGKMLPTELFEVIGDAMFAGGENATLNEALSQRSERVIKLLQDAKVITQQNYGDYIAKEHGKVTGKLSAPGRASVRLAIMGALVDNKEYMMLLAASQERLLEQISCPLLVLHSQDPGNLKGFNLVPAIRPAIGLVSYTGATSPQAFEQKFHTEEIRFGAEAGPQTLEQQFPAVFTDPLSAIMAKWLVEASQQPRLAYESVRQYVDGTKPDMFGDPPDPETLRTRTLGSRFFSAADTQETVRSIGISRWLAGLGEHQRKHSWAPARKQNPIHQRLPDLARQIFEALKEGETGPMLRMLERARDEIIKIIETAILDAEHIDPRFIVGDEVLFRDAGGTVKRGQIQWIEGQKRDLTTEHLEDDITYQVHFRRANARSYMHESKLSPAEPDLILGETRDQSAIRLRSSVRARIQLYMQAKGLEISHTSLAKLVKRHSSEVPGESIASRIKVEGEDLADLIWSVGVDQKGAIETAIYQMLYAAKEDHNPAPITERDRAAELKILERELARDFTRFQSASVPATHVSRNTVRQAWVQRRIAALKKIVEKEGVSAPQALKIFDEAFFHARRKLTEALSLSETLPLEDFDKAHILTIEALKELKKAEDAVEYVRPERFEKKSRKAAAEAFEERKAEIEALRKEIEAGSSLIFERKDKKSKAELAEAQPTEAPRPKKRARPARKKTEIGPVIYREDAIGTNENYTVEVILGKGNTFDVDGFITGKGPEASVPLRSDPAYRFHFRDVPAAEISEQIRLVKEGFPILSRAWRVIVDDREAAGIPIRQGNPPSQSEQYARLLASLKHGKRMPDAVYVTTESVRETPLVAQAMRQHGISSRKYSVIKLHLGEPVIGFMEYPAFYTARHPELKSWITVDLQKGVVDQGKASEDNPPILHRKEEMMGEEQPSERARASKSTAREERAGLYRSPESIGTRRGWKDVIARKGNPTQGELLLRKHEDRDER
jgi:hypothetical protein